MLSLHSQSCPTCEVRMGTLTEKIIFTDHCAGDKAFVALRTVMKDNLRLFDCHA